MADPALTPEVLEELTQKRAATVTNHLLGTEAYADYLQMLDEHAPALLAAAQRVQELEAKLEVAEIKVAVGYKIRRYVSFVLTGDESSDVQLAADQTKKEIDRLRARVAELEGDKDRILWLSRVRTGSYVNYDLISYWPVDGDGWAAFNEQARDDNEPLSVHKSFRAAIDAARQAEKETT